MQNPWKIPYQHDLTRLAYIFRKTGMTTDDSDIGCQHQQFLNHYALPLAKALSGDCISTIPEFVAKLRWRLLLSEIKGIPPISDSNAVQKLVDYEGQFLSDTNIDDDADNLRKRVMACNNDPVQKKEPKPKPRAHLNFQLKKIASGYFGPLPNMPPDMWQYMYLLYAYEAAFCCLMFDMQPIPEDVQAYLSFIPMLIEKQTYVPQIHNLVSKHRTVRTQKKPTTSRGAHHSFKSRPEGTYLVIKAFLDWLRLDDCDLYYRCRLAFLYKLTAIKNLQQDKPYRLRDKSSRISFIEDLLNTMPYTDSSLLAAMTAYVNDRNHHDDPRGSKIPVSFWGEDFALRLHTAFHNFTEEYRSSLFSWDKENDLMLELANDFFDHWFNRHHDMNHPNFKSILPTFLDDVIKINEYFDVDHDFGMLLKFLLRD